MKETLEGKVLKEIENKVRIIYCFLICFLVVGCCTQKNRFDCYNDYSYFEEIKNSDIQFTSFEKNARIVRTRIILEKCPGYLSHGDCVRYFNISSDDYGFIDGMNCSKYFDCFKLNDKFSYVIPPESYKSFLESWSGNDELRDSLLIVYNNNRERIRKLSNPSEDVVIKKIKRNYSIFQWELEKVNVLKFSCNAKMLEVSFDQLGSISIFTDSNEFSRVEAVLIFPSMLE